MDPELRAAAESATGFMPTDEGLALYDAARRSAPLGPVVEVGTYCAKSTLYLAAAARETGGHVVTVDHHRGSEENQPGWEWHDPSLVDPELDRLDTLPHARRTLALAGVEDVVTVVVGDSTRVASWWGPPAGMVFVDGGHGREVARADYEAWSDKVAVGGLFVVHDVFEHPEDGGQAPYEELYVRALESGRYTEVGATGSLRVLERTAGQLVS